MPILVIDWIGGCVDLAKALRNFFSYILLTLYYLPLRADQLVCSHSCSSMIITSSLHLFSLCPACVLNEVCLFSEYPSFHICLDTFLDRDVLHVKHRSRFSRFFWVRRTWRTLILFSGIFLNNLSFFVQTFAFDLARFFCQQALAVSAHSTHSWDSDGHSVYLQQI